MTGLSPEGRVAIDLRIAELLASRLCHDLVGPIGAIGNGMELLEEGGSEFDEEATGLVADSARKAAAALRFYRLAYGAAGAESADMGEARVVALDYLGSGRVEIAWPDPFPGPGLAGLPKLLLNMVAAAVETLPRGGRIAVARHEEAGRTHLLCTAEGVGAELRSEARANLEAAVLPPAEEVTARGVQSLVARLLAERLGGALSQHFAEGRVELVASIAR